MQEIGLKDKIAIIGMGCRFPGKANNPELFWKLLKEGQDAITEVPSERWSIRSFYHPSQTVKGKIITKYGGFIEHVSEFDPSFFGISPQEAQYMDPQQRLLLEVVYETLEEGGHLPSQYRGKNVGVYIGAFGTDYLNLNGSVTADSTVNSFSATGVLNTILSNRISYSYDWKGPSMTIDTACSSSLVALHLACESLKNRECDAAIAGGVLLMLSPYYSIIETQGGFLSPDGRCKTFDCTANGYVRGEGVGTVFLKRLEDALADGDVIEGVILASGINQDGHTQGLTKPNSVAQEALMRRVCQKAGITPEMVEYIEAHGTGTKVGDPIEASAIANVYGHLNRELVVGSCKTNIGHTESAAGMAGLIKVLLMMRHQQIAPHLHLKQLNPSIHFEEAAIRIPQKVEAWQSERRIAAINSFGFGGTNSHVVIMEPLKEWQTYQDIKCQDTRYQDTKHQNIKITQNLSRPYILPISATNEDVCLALEKKYATLDLEAYTMQDLCYSAATLRDVKNFRKAYVFSHKEQLAEALSNLKSPINLNDVAIFKGKGTKPNKGIVFVYSGMGAQWVGMGRELYQKEAVYKETFKRCSEIFYKLSKISLEEELFKEVAPQECLDIRIYQPLHITIQIALSALYKSVGIVPEVVVGHSVGEIAAFYAAGYYGLEETMTLIYYRSQYLHTFKGQGTMLAVEMSEEEVRKLLQKYTGSVWLACINAPMAMVLSGEKESCQEIYNQVKAEGRKATFLKVDIPFHSQLLEGVKAAFLKDIEGIKCLKDTEGLKNAKELQSQSRYTKLISTVTGESINNHQIDTAYWWQNIINTVQFEKAINTLMAEGYFTYLEIGAHPILLNAIATNGTVENKVLIGSMNKKEKQQFTFMKSLAQLFVKGYDLDWEKVLSVGKKIQLPITPWQHKVYWSEPKEIASHRLGKDTEDFLGRRLDCSKTAFEFSFSLYSLPFLKDHKVLNQITYPAACYYAMFSKACEQVYHQQFSMHNLEFTKAIVIEEKSDIKVQTWVNLDENKIEVYLRNGTNKYSLCAATKLRVSRQLAKGNISLAEVKEEMSNYKAKKEIYKALQTMAFEYGKAFQQIEEAWYGVDKCLAKIHTHNELTPTVLDACFQTLLIADMYADTQEFKMPVRIEKINLLGELTSSIWAIGRLRERTSEKTIGDLWIYNEKCELIGEILGFERRIIGTKQIEQPEEWTYKKQWQLLEDEELYKDVLDNKELIRNTLVEEKLTKAPSDDKESWLIFDAAFHNKIHSILEHNNIRPINGMFYCTPKDVETDEGKCIEKQCMEILKAHRPTHILFYVEDVPDEYFKYRPHLLLTIMKAIINSGVGCKLWVITKGSYKILDTDKLSDTPQAVAVIGLARTFGYQENKSYLGGIIDLAYDNTLADNIDALINYINSTKKKQKANVISEIAIRNKQFYQLKLIKDDQKTICLKPEFREDGAYLIVGAFSAITKEIIQYMINFGARKLIFITKSVLTNERLMFIESIRQQGVAVCLSEADVTDYKTLENCIESMKLQENIIGVIYSVGLLKDTLIETMTRRDFDLVYDTKVLGALYLHQLLKAEPLEFFTVFSSVAALLPGMGQGNYAAANCVLDALCAYRRQLGLPGIAINWGPWTIGMVREQHVEEQMAREGLELITPSLGQKLFWRSLHEEESQIIFIKPNGNKKHLLLQDKEEECDEVVEESHLERLKKMNEFRRVQYIKEVVLKLISQMLETEVTQIDTNSTLLGLGLDSLSATYLKEQIGMQLGVNILIGELIGSLSIEQMSNIVVERVLKLLK